MIAIGDAELFTKKLEERINTIAVGNSNLLVRLSFSKHFVERISERAKFEELSIISTILHRTIKNHLSELILYSHLEQRPERCEIVNGRLVIGLKYSNLSERFVATTFVNSRKHKGNSKTFVIEPLK